METVERRQDKVKTYVPKGFVLPCVLCGFGVMCGFGAGATTRKHPHKRADYTVRNWHVSAERLPTPAALSGTTKSVVHAVKVGMASSVYCLAYRHLTHSLMMSNVLVALSVLAACRLNTRVLPWWSGRQQVSSDASTGIR